MIDITTPGAEEALAQEMADNPYLMTRFSFEETVCEDEAQREFMQLLTSGLLWEDGSKLALGLIGDRNGNLLEDEDVIGCIIDPDDDFWKEESDNGMSLLDNLIWHQCFHQSPVTFGRKDEWDDESKRGGGYFRLALEGLYGEGPIRWAMVDFDVTMLHHAEHRHIPESIERLKKRGWDVWRIDEWIVSKERKFCRMMLFIVAPEPVKHSSMLYAIQKDCMKHLKKLMLNVRGREAIQPSRRRELKMLPVPILNHTIIPGEVKVKLTKC